MHFFNLYVWSANYSDFSKVWQMKLIGNILHPGPQHKNFPGNLSFGNKSPFNLGIDLFPQRQGWLSHLSGHLHVCNMTVVPVSLSGLNHLIQQHFFGGRIFWWEYLPKGAPRDSQQALSFWWWGKAVCHQTYPLFLMDGLKSKRMHKCPVTQVHLKITKHCIMCQDDKTSKKQNYQYASCRTVAVVFRQFGASE